MAKTRPGGLISKPKTGKRDLDSYTIRGTTKVVRVGDCVMMRPSDTGRPSYVARIEGMEADSRNNVKVRVRWYYRPEESLGGRRQFHGAKELFLSDHYDVQSAHTIEGKCIVHSFKNYTKLENVGAEDYYCRFEYKAATGGFTPDRVAVYCKCEMPYNPDDLMVQCEGCKDWYHPACVDMTIEEAKKLDHFVCSECASDDDVKRSQNGFSLSSVADVKVFIFLLPCVRRYLALIWLHGLCYTRNTIFTSTLFPDPLSSSSGIWRVGRKQAPEEISAVSSPNDRGVLCSNWAVSSFMCFCLVEYKKISVYLVLLEGETLAFHGSHLSHEGRKSVHTTPSQANKLQDATRVKLVEKGRGAKLSDDNLHSSIPRVTARSMAEAQAIATDLNTSVDFFSPFDVVGHGRVPVIVVGFYHGKASEMAPRARTVNILHRIFLINLRAADSVAQATMDGSADILTLSVGPDELPEDDIPFSRVCDVFMLFARGAGALVAQAAGNHGPAFPTAVYSCSQHIQKLPQFSSWKWSKTWRCRFTRHGVLVEYGWHSSIHISCTYVKT
ncbi:hypothetical protein D5086_007741 [Populus alba]|uniref:Uncharacterized protein n=1 Tax=Populus alba TaxID=43335 RepID=A0ACC4CDQ5_POPAL